MEILIGFLILLIIGIGVYFAFFFKKKPGFTENQIKSFNKKVKLISSPSYSEREKVMELDKLYHHILKEAGYEGSFGEILKQTPRCISDIDEIWRLHKIRNKLAHDFEEFEIIKLKKEVRNYTNEIQNLIKTLK